jgi:hypothetical protein
LEEGKRLLELHASRYVGQGFPTSTLDSAADFAVLRIFDEEPTEGGELVSTALMQSLGESKP